MRLTEKDHETRMARLADGTSPDPDDDRRLVKLYERQGEHDGADPDMMAVMSGDAHLIEAPEPRPRARRGRNAQR